LLGDLLSLAAKLEHGWPLGSLHGMRWQLPEPRQNCPEAFRRGLLPVR
jgi:hypothetical protein